MIIRYTNLLIIQQYILHYNFCSATAQGINKAIWMKWNKKIAISSLLRVRNFYHSTLHHWSQTTLRQKVVWLHDLESWQSWVNYAISTNQQQPPLIFSIQGLRSLSHPARDPLLEVSRSRQIHFLSLIHVTTRERHEKLKRSNHKTTFAILTNV